MALASKASMASRSERGSGGQRVGAVGVADERRRRLDLLLDARQARRRAGRPARGTGCSRRRGCGTRCAGSRRGPPAGSRPCGCRSSRRPGSAPTTRRRSACRSSPSGRAAPSARAPSAGSRRGTSAAPASPARARMPRSSSPAKALRPSRHRLRCTWQLDPARSACGLAMNVTLTPCRSAVSLRHCLNTHVAVGRLEDVGVADVHLVLAEAPLALRALHRHARAAEVAPHRGVEVLGARALLELVVLEVPAGRLEVGEAASGRVAVATCGTGSARARWPPSPRARRRRAARPAARRIVRGATSVGSWVAWRRGRRRARARCGRASRPRRSVARSGTRWTSP